jgi:ABC-type transport system substrate-binding protein
MMADWVAWKRLMMSLDRPAINKIVGPGGGCEPYCSVLNRPFGPDLYTSFEELPKSIQEILTYNPEKAKKLLADDLNL